MKISQHLWFEKDMEAAVRFYASLIPGSRIETFSAVNADNPSGPAGGVKVASFTLGDQNYMAIEAGPMFKFNESFSIVVQCDSQAEIDRLWDALREGGSTSACGWLKDRWGLSWQITAKRLFELMSDPDPARSRRVTEAFMKTTKVDIAAMEAAAAG